MNKLLKLMAIVLFAPVVAMANPTESPVALLQCRPDMFVTIKSNSVGLFFTHNKKDRSAWERHELRFFSTDLRNYRPTSFFEADNKLLLFLSIRERKDKNDKFVDVVLQEGVKQSTYTCEIIKMDDNWK